MSVLAGFDYATEISNATITKLFKSTVQIAGVLVNPPFDLSLSGGGHLIVDDLQLDLEGDDTINISFAFSKSSFVLPAPQKTVTTTGAPGSLVIAPLDGTLTVNVALKLVAGFGKRREVSGDMAGAVVRIDYSPAAEQVITSTLSGSGVAVGVFKNGVVEAITQAVRREPPILIDFGHDVVPNTDGKIDPDIQLSSLQMRCIGHSDRSRQALSLLGNFFAATQNNGNRVNKSDTAILPGQDFATSFSLQAVHSLIFCPSVAKSMARQTGAPNLAVTDLPTSCGGASSLTVSDIKLTSLLDTYLNGAIHLFGSIEKSGFCYEASGRFTGRAEPVVAADGRSLTFKATVDEPDIDVAIDWYCELAVVGLLGYFSLTVVADVENVMGDFAATVAKSALSKNLLSGPGSAGPIAPIGLRFSAVSITAESMIIQGRLDISVPFVDSSKFISIAAVSDTEEATGAIQGNWKTQLSCMPEAKNYSYVETQQRHVDTFDLRAQLVLTPLSVEYSVRGTVRGIGDLPQASGASIPLSANVALTVGSGWRTVTVANVECMYPLPLGTGGTKVTQDVHLDYLITGTQIQIANRQPAEGNFFIQLEGSVLDATGKIPAGVNAKPTLWIMFQGDSVIMDDEYMTDQAECARKALGNIPRDYIPDWSFEFDPSPAWRMFAEIRALKEMELQGKLRNGEAEKLFLQSQIAHGDSVTRAFRASLNPSLGTALGAAEESATLKAVAGELRSQLRTLTDRLAVVERARGGLEKDLKGAFGRALPR